MNKRKWLNPLLSGLWALSLCGCGVSNLEFVADKRVAIMSPKNLAVLHLPVTVRWTVRGFTVAAEGNGRVNSDTGYFVILVDHAPVAPGQTLQVLAHGDNACLHTAGCPNAEYLANRQVYATTATTFTIDRVADLNTHHTVQLHEITIILMNTDGHRIGESAWYVDFRLRQGTN